MSKIHDLTGQTFGTLTVIERAENDKYGNAQWLCKCLCGKEVVKRGYSLTTGNIKSCGDKIHRPSQLKEDLTNKQFGKWTVLRREENTPDGSAQWLCQCVCGKQMIHSSHVLTSGKTKSCGCSMNEYIDNSINLLGQIFGNFKVIKRAGSDKWQHALWECECMLCHQYSYYTTSQLRSNKFWNCKCQKNKSHGEQIIINLLNQNHIIFEEQKSFDTCIFPDTQYLAKFDFWVNNTYLIEYDGIQHFKFIDNKNSWDTKEKLEYTQQHDAYKNNWCKENNIPLIRIPYTHLKKLTIEDLLLETSEFLV